MSTIPDHPLPGIGPDNPLPGLGDLADDLVEDLDHSSRFSIAQSSTIEVDGEPVHSVVRVELPPQAVLQLSRVSANAIRPQGIVVELSASAKTGARLECNAACAERLTVWSHTAPDHVEIAVNTDRRATVCIWNTWRDPDGDHAWVGWAGMRRHMFADGRARLECSDGHPPGSFDDLVVDITIEGADQQPIERPN